jgi:hypothetical protein
MTLQDLAQADIVVEDHGSVVMLRPMTRAGAVWLHENVSSEPWQWMGNGLAAEPRMVREVLEGAQDAGLMVAW